MEEVNTQFENEQALRSVRTSWYRWRNGAKQQKRGQQGNDRVAHDDQAKVQCKALAQIIIWYPPEIIEVEKDKQKQENQGFLLSYGMLKETFAGPAPDGQHRNQKKSHNAERMQQDGFRFLER